MQYINMKAFAHSDNQFKVVDIRFTNRVDYLLNAIHHSAGGNDLSLNDQLSNDLSCFQVLRYDLAYAD